MKFFKWLLKERSVGCGPSFLPQCVVNLFFGWWFGNPCAAHDVRYTIGGSAFRKIAADWGFFKDMLRSIKSVKWVFKPLALIVSILFFVIVLLIGWFRFNYT